MCRRHADPERVAQHRVAGQRHAGRDDGSRQSRAAREFKLYYNLDSYASLTDYAAISDPTNGPIIKVTGSGSFGAYMYVDLILNIGKRTYDNGTAATINSISVRGALQSGAAAAFADKNVGTAKTATISLF